MKIQNCLCGHFVSRNIICRNHLSRQDTVAYVSFWSASIVHMAAEKCPVAFVFCYIVTFTPWISFELFHLIEISVKTNKRGKRGAKRGGKRGRKNRRI